MKHNKKANLVASEILTNEVVKGMQEKKATDIVILDLREIKQAVADFFVICTGNSDNQLDAIATSVDKEVYEVLGEHPQHQEGRQNREWILLDYIDVVAHIFHKSKRNHFALEDLWGDAKMTTIDNLD